MQELKRKKGIADDGRGGEKMELVGYEIEPKLFSLGKAEWAM